MKKNNAKEIPDIEKDGITLDQGHAESDKYDAGDNEDQEEKQANGKKDERKTE